MCVMVSFSLELEILRMSSIQIKNLNGRLGNEKYKSKTSWQFRWLEQFDLHLFDGEQHFHALS